MRRSLPVFILLSLGALCCSCNFPSRSTDQDLNGTGAPGGSEAVDRSQIEAGSSTERPATVERSELPRNLIDPADLTYLGAFRLPDVSGDSSWEYSGYAMAYNPLGDPAGPEDGFPGSLFAVGHDHQQYVSEISIPVPVLSSNKDPEELNTAGTMQPFADITDGRFGYLEIPRAGLEILPPQGEQDEWKLYFAWGQHFEDAWNPTHGWSSLDLSAPRTAGPWHVAGFSNYITNDYLFEIPETWAAAYTPGLRLAAGRFRDGIWGGLGPTLVAIGPWLDGNPPAQGATLEHAQPLLLYGRQLEGNLEIDSSGIQPMATFSEPDEWSGGAWLTAGDSAAVIFVGTKAVGRSWYGFSNGVVYPTSGDPNETYPDVPAWPHDQRGWWSEDVSAQILFYDPADLASVAQGEMEAWQPQPYASRSIDGLLFDPGFDYENSKRYLLGAAAFDRTRGLLYIVERRADGDRSLIHVFEIARD
jgi:hypothetical protein